MYVNSRLKSHLDYKSKESILETSCLGKETVDIDILVTSRDSDRKIMQSIRITSTPLTRKSKSNQLSQLSPK